MIRKASVPPPADQQAILLQKRLSWATHAFPILDLFSLYDVPLRSSVNKQSFLNQLQDDLPRAFKKSRCFMKIKLYLSS